MYCSTLVSPPQKVESICDKVAAVDGSQTGTWPALELKDTLLTKDMIKGMTLFTSRDPDEDAPPRLTYAETKALYSANIYRDYLRLVTLAAVKAYNSKPTMGQRESLQEQAVRLLKRTKGRTQLASKLRNRGKWKLGGHELNSRDFIQEVIKPAVECGLLRVVSGDDKALKVAIASTRQSTGVQN